MVGDQLKRVVQIIEVIVGHQPEAAVGVIVIIDLLTGAPAKVHPRPWLQPLPRKCVMPESDWCAWLGNPFK